MADESEELPDKLKFADHADMSLEEYIALHPETASEDEDGISLEDYLAEGNQPFLVNAFPSEDGISVAAVTEGTWVEVSSGVWKYRLANGNYASGWVQDGTGFWFYLDPNNDRIMVTGWKKIGSYWYYFQTNGRMKHGWMSSTGYSGNTIYYYMGTPGDNDSGAMYTGGWLHDVDGKWYYFQPLDEDTWVMQTGLLTIDGKKYYFGSDGAMVANSWYTLSGNRYYFGSDGAAYTGMRVISGNKYYFNSSGVMYKGWLSYNGSIYYCQSDGVIIRDGTKQTEYVISYFDSNGALDYDVMVEKNPGDHGYPLNVRWDNVQVIGSNRKAVLTVNGDDINSVYSEITTGIEPVTTAINNYQALANDWVDMSYASKNSADVIVTWALSSNFATNQAAVTCQKNSDGEWVNGLMQPGASGTVSSYSVGTTVYAVIYFNTLTSPRDIGPGEFSLGSQNVDNGIAYVETVDVFSASLMTKVVMHELGHVLGLRHTFEDGEQVSSISALMHPYYNQQSSTFQTYDYNELEKTYPQ